MSLKPFCAICGEQIPENEKVSNELIHIKQEGLAQSKRSFYYRLTITHYKQHGSLQGDLCVPCFKVLLNEALEEWWPTVRYSNVPPPPFSEPKAPYDDVPF